MKAMDSVVILIWKKIYRKCQEKNPVLGEKSGISQKKCIQYFINKLF